MGKIIDKEFVQYILDEMNECVKQGNFVVGDMLPPLITLRRLKWGLLAQAS